MSVAAVATSIHKLWHNIGCSPLQVSIMCLKWLNLLVSFFLHHVSYPMFMTMTMSIDAIHVYTCMHKQYVSTLTCSISR